MTRSSNLDLNSEVIIVDENYKEYDFSLYAIKDLYYGEDKVRIQLRPKKVEVKATEKVQDKIIKEELLGIVEEVKEGQVEEVQTSRRNWWDKYK